MRDIDGRLVPEEILEGIKEEIMISKNSLFKNNGLNITSIHLDKKKDEYSVEYICSGFSHIRIGRTYLIRKIGLKKIGII